jgi:hypothetical protein
MGIEHQLARLTAKGPPLTGAGFGGIAEISQTDIAAAMSGLEGPAYWYMRLKFIGDPAEFPRLRDALAFQMLGEAMMGEFDLSAKHAPGLATVAIRQATGGGLCDACNGTKLTITADSVADCKPCKGTGKLKMTQDLAASIAKVSTPTYVKKYERIVDHFVSRLELYESQGLSHISRRLYGKRAQTDG